MGQAWYQPKPFSPIPIPKRTGEQSEDEEGDGEDDEEGLMRSVEYICALIDKEVCEAGVPLDRIVVGGFSQGCAVSLLVRLMGRYCGRLGGVVGMSGYLPLGRKVENAVRERKGKAQQSRTKWFLAHGTRDQLVPMRIFRKYRDKLVSWEGDNVEAKAYNGMPHSTSGAEIRDLCYWLEKVLPGQAM